MKIIELQRCENHVFFLPVNIYICGVARWLLRPHDTLLCVLIPPHWTIIIHICVIVYISCYLISYKCVYVCSLYLLILD